MADEPLSLDGVIDLHIHAGPDVRPRKMTALEVARAAQAAGMRGVLLKNHHTSTVLQAAAARELCPGIHVFGSLALNEWVGGFNPAAAEASLKMGAAEIWMPTLSAANERNQRGEAGCGLTIWDTNGRLLPGVLEILKLVAEHKAILGTGHLAPVEIAALVKAARQAGVRKILITHPEINFIKMPVAMQKELNGPGLYFERCYARPLFESSWDGLAATVREVGVESTVLSTDLGQPENPEPVVGMRQMLQEFSGRGFSRAELDVMTRRNPATLLGLG